ncbi:MAG: ectoine/hydroxyectoine ABC transporter permease subunit EhuC [Elainellaceae cyanobacterium]
MTLVELLPPILKGFSITLGVMILGALLALLMAFVAGWGKVSELKPIRYAATIYVELFRGTSLLVQLFWLYFALPQLLGIRLSPFLAAVLTFGLHFGAYGAEVFRGAVNNIKQGQYEAAAALSLNRIQTMRMIIVPQALVAMMPPFTNLLIELLKATPLVSLITLADMTFQGQLLRSETLQSGSIFTLLLILYFIIAILLTFAMRKLERRLSYGLDRGGA